ncbi:MAG: TrmH family RNA methyltransferase [Proteobacteria bacterium]|nr:RNA methyltransferase [Alphaproteobacteria bacterium]NCC03269.1 TrmH family RNA methyltransferase [Pseudomonadota bacterium]
MRGYFGVGVEGISKSFNLGNLVRTSHAFGASFFFTVGSSLNYRNIRASDTSHAAIHMPMHEYETVEEFTLPKDCALVGVELLAEAVDLPTFRHPLRAAYVLGPEKGSLSPAMVARCDHIVKIPMKFCVNVGVAGALCIYDRMICLGSFAERPVSPGVRIK